MLPERESSWETKSTSFDFMKSSGFGATFEWIWAFVNLSFSSSSKRLLLITMLLLVAELVLLVAQESNEVLVKKSIAVKSESRARISSGHRFFWIATHALCFPISDSDSDSDSDWFRYNIQSRRILEVSVPICYLERVCDGLRRKCRMITRHWAVGSVSSGERKINLMLRHLKEEMSNEFLFLGFEISHIYLGPAYLIFSQVFLNKAYWLFWVGVCKKLVNPKNWLKLVKPSPIFQFSFGTVQIWFEFLKIEIFQFWIWCWIFSLWN